MIVSYNRTLLIEGARSLGIELTQEAISSFDIYADLLVDYNQKVNLTAITDPDGIAVKHFLDSIAPLPLLDLEKGVSIVDVGTGAGFPSVPMKIVRPDLKITLMDSLQKRLVFLALLSGRLGQQNVTAHNRAEQAGIETAHREHYDIAIARAVADMRALVEYCLPLVKVGGRFIALKGGDCDKELEAAANAISLLGGGKPEVKRFSLPGDLSRSVVIIKKISQTPPKYPRQHTNFSEKPL